MNQAAPVSGYDLILEQDCFEYDGSEKKPGIAVMNGENLLTEGTDYTVSYSDNINAGTVTVTAAGTGNYAGTLTASFTVRPAVQRITAEISAAELYIGDTAQITASAEGELSYSTSDTDIAVVDSTGHIKGVGEGTAVIAIHADETENYEESDLTLTITVSRIDINDTNVTLSETQYTYDGSEKKPAVTVTRGDAVLKEGTDYTVSYRDNINAGVATVIVTGIGNYTGSIEKIFHIDRAAISSQTVKAGTTTAIGSFTYQVTASSSSKKTVTVTGANKSSAASITIPDTVTIDGSKYKVTAIEDSAFSGYKKLKTVKIGSNVTTIGSKAFCSCTALTKVTGCAAVITIGSKAFYQCTKLTRVGSKSSTVTLAKIRTIGSSAFYGCKALKKVNLASTALTMIRSSAFQGCTAMTSFTAKSTKLKSIGKKAFYGDRKLATVTLKTSKLTKSSVKTSASKGIKSTCTFKVPLKKVSAYRKIFQARGAGSRITVKKS